MPGLNSIVLPEREFGFLRELDDIQKLRFYGYLVLVWDWSDVSHSGNSSEVTASRTDSGDVTCIYLRRFGLGRDG